VQVSGGETGAQFPVQASSAYLSAVTDASAAFDRATAAVNAEVVHIIGECTSLLATLKGCVTVLPRVFHNKLTHTILCASSLACDVGLDACDIACSDASSRIWVLHKIDDCTSRPHWRTRSSISVDCGWCCRVFAGGW
jgi:hypothetical protein